MSDALQLKLLLYNPNKVSNEIIFELTEFIPFKN